MLIAGKEYHGGDLKIIGNMSFTSLPDDLEVTGDLIINECTSLEYLPSRLRVIGSLDLTDCPSLKSLPDDIQISGSILLIRCKSLTKLPESLTVLGNLDLVGCTSLQSLPDNLTVEGWIDASYSSLTCLPKKLRMLKRYFWMFGCASLLADIPNIVSDTSQLIVKRFQSNQDNDYGYNVVSGSDTYIHNEEVEKWCGENNIDLIYQTIFLETFNLTCITIDDPAQLIYYRLKWG